MIKNKNKILVEEKKNQCFIFHIFAFSFSGFDKREKNIRELNINNANYFQSSFVLCSLQKLD